MGTTKSISDAVFRDYETDGVPSTPVWEPKKPEIRSLFGDVDTRLGSLEAGQAGGSVVFATWAELAAHPATIAGARGESRETSGTHTDPVTGATVANGGVFSWSTSPAGWKRVGDPPNYSPETIAISTLGVAAPVDAASAALSGKTWIVKTKAPYSGVIASVSFYCNLAQTGAIIVFIDNGDGTVTPVSSATIAVTIGSNIFTKANLAVGVNQLVGVYLPRGGLKYDTAVATGYWQVSGLPTGAVAYVNSNTTTLQISVVVNGDVTYSARNVPAIKALAGEQKFIGPAPVSSASSVLPTYSWYYAEPVAEDCELSRVEFYVNSWSNPIRLQVATLNVDGTITRRIVKLLNWVVGYNNFKFVGIKLKAGDRIGLYNAYLHASTSGPVELWFHSGETGTSTVISQAYTQIPMMRFTLSTGLTRQTIGGPLSEVGAGMLDGVDNTGATDATADVALARAAHPNVHVPRGKFSLSTLPSFSGDGYWGPGKPYVNGKRFFIDRSPRPTSLYYRLRASMMPQIYTNSSLIFIGDSIMQGLAATTYKNHVIEMLTSYLNIECAPDDQPIFTRLDAPDANMSITVGGSVTVGTNGPIGASGVMAVGAYYEFVGAYEQVDMFYTADPAAGSLVFSYNGAAYKTVNCAASAELDKFTGPSLTGQTASGTYRVACTGAPVEVTGLVRLGVKAANSPKRLRVSRAAHGGYSTYNFAGNPSRVTSMLKQASYAGGTRHKVCAALGMNDQFGRSPAQIYSDVTTLIGLLTAGGVKISDIFGFGVWRSNSGGGYPSGSSYEDAMGAMRAAYQDAGVRMIPLDAIDMLSLVPSGGGVHPDDGGFDAHAQVVAESLASFG